ncbi:MAG: tryptophan-rich sensory protein [Myxococcales bacterium]|nr:tryptophan-rich sensory protein [Myxococcales bacterium]
MTRDILSLAGFVFLTLAVGAIGSQFLPGPWYEALEKPPGNPPNQVFGPVWTALYIAIAVAAWRVWRRGASGAETRGPLALWGAQLVVNALWSWLFFGLERVGIALLDIGLLLGLVIATGLAFHRVDRVAGLLFVPYAAWVAFATYLNAGLWWLNR